MSVGLLHDVGISSICGETTLSQWSVMSPVTAAPALLASSGASLVGELSLSIIHTIHIMDGIVIISWYWRKPRTILLINLFRINSDAIGPAAWLSAACQFDTNSKFLDLELSDKPAFMSFCSLYLLFCQKTCEKTYINTPLVFFGSL